MIKKLFVLVLALAGVMSVASIAYGAQRGPTRVTLPDFKVTINGQVVNNSYSQYPLIVYNDITYFPMTYNDCRYLGIESTWKGDKEGLLVDATGVTAAYNPYLSSRKNIKTYMAKVVNFPIKVNGESVDNSKEEYPLLSFRDITYFPMTWKYSVDEFGWDYKFDGQKGLVINSKNIKLSQIDIPQNRPKEAYGDFAGKKGTEVFIKDGYVYYGTDKGAIMRAPLSDTGKGKKIYELGQNSYTEGYNNHNFYEENGKSIFFFHSGGATMGSDHKHEINPDGTLTEIQSSYYETTPYGNKLYMYWLGPTPEPGNLRVRNLNEEESAQLGSPDYWYYGLTQLKGLSTITLVGNDLYIKAAPVMSNSIEAGVKLGITGVYKVDVNTNQTTKVNKAAEAVLTGQIEGEYLYYLTEGKNVYKTSLKDGTESLLGKAEGVFDSYWDTRFAVLGGKGYFIKEDYNLYALGSNVSLNPKAEVIRMNVTGDNMEYLVCTFKESAASKYRIMIFDKGGKVVFKTSDCGNNVVVESDTIYFYNITTEKVCSGKIKT